MADEDASWSSDFENGMLAGFVDGVSSIQQLLIKAAEDRASTAPATSAYLKALTVGIGKYLPDALKSYHKREGLSVPLEVAVTSEDRKWN